ncbi:unnamed protein product [Rotaria sordida]|uniref:Uncharacterized protein n=1 Tax=Rotaria sordida TaxID=392033 RepID=A0A819R1H1_9BILA|nr:unnamed protein product [Rotaria sordida]CAF1507101.1 unnamed protein product [Rotaria sordida]CAF4040624.1 unnamed protein product [Rotaria sordida]CAF4081536.1 unnamed protein product [Rotaria sordida]
MNNVIEPSVQHKGGKLRGTLSNNGSAISDQTLMLQIEIDNPNKLIIKSIRAILKQYRLIKDQQTNIIIFSSVLSIVNAFMN